MKEDLEAIQQKVNEFEHSSFAFSVLEIYKNANKRLFIVLLATLCMWFTTILLSVYVNKIGIDSLVRTQQQITEKQAE